MPTRQKRFSFLHQYTSAILIFLLFVSQTIQVSFFDRVEADARDYRDVVSIVVDADTYGSLRAKITRYANDIQTYLKSTRVTVFVTPDDARPEVIAAHNEKLYYEGDGGAGVSKLVGTIIIGNVPIPVVRKEGLSFPSLYPYTDFDDKRFVYEQQSGLYVFSREARESSDVDIWHGVINPALGRDWQGGSDIVKIGNFFDKTHEFYTRSGKFVPMTTAPRVFYYDGYNESLSTDPATMYKYALYTQNIENITYNRWSKYLLSDIMQAMRDFQGSQTGAEDAYARTLGLTGVLADDTMDQATIEKLPDIQTREPILAYLKKFYETINKKTLSDIQKYVHNAGRYNSGTIVRVDQGAIAMTMTDEIANQTLKGANEALEKSIDTLLTTAGYAKPLVIFDGYTSKYIPTSVSAVSQPAMKVEYKNYFFGREARTITDPIQCTIARGGSGTMSTFGQDVLVEANVAYDINSPESQIATLSGDTAELVGIQARARNRSAANYACFEVRGGTPKLGALYGGNSILRMMTLGVGPEVYFSSLPGGTSFRDFASPAQSATGILSLGGMKETARLTSPSLANCIDRSYQYTLLQPFIYDYLEETYCGDSLCTTTCQAAYPDEWNIAGGYPCTKRPGTATPRLSCLTSHTTGSVVSSLANGIAKYSTACTYGTITIDGKYLSPTTGTLSAIASSFGSPCITTVMSGDSEVTTDTTIYEDQKYHTIPSLLHHISPTTDEIDAAEKNGVTPSLPIDIIRSVEFLTPKGGIAKIEYPNFFSSSAPGTSIAEVRTWLATLSSATWNPILTAESSRMISPIDTGLNTSLSVHPLPGAPIDWNTLISDEAIEKILQAKKWMNKNVTEKYTDRVEASLSYSQSFTGERINNLPLNPRLSEGYEIAYLGLSSFIPRGEADTDESLEEYRYRLGEIQGLNFAEYDDGLLDPERKASAQCGPPEGVNLFQWPAAIACWAKSLFPIKIVAGSCGGNSIGLKSGPIPSVAPPADITRNSTALRNYYADGRLVYTIDRTALAPGESIGLKYHLDRAGTLVSLSPDAGVSIDITSITSSGRSILPSEYEKYLEISSPESAYTAEGSAFALYAPGPLATVTIRPLLTVPLPDGTSFTLRAEPLSLRITDEYIDIRPMVESLPVATIDTTLTGAITLALATKKAGTETVLGPSPPYQLTIRDDLDGALIESGITVSGQNWTLPARYRNTIAVYRITATDALGRTGESTLAVRSGPLSKMDFHSISSTIAVGATSYGVLRLLDARDNLVSPTLHHLTADISGGSFLDANGDKQSSLSIDTMDSELVFSYVSETPGSVQVRFRSTDIGIETLASIRSVELPRVRLVRSGQLTAGGSGANITLEVLTRDGQVLSGFSSLATFDIPEAAGSFQSGTVELVNGRSPSLIFQPGKAAGDHVIRVDIPGIGPSDHRITIVPGPSMYIDASIEETTVDFTLRDRYGNATSDNLGATLEHNLASSGSVNFMGGKYSMSRVPGYWRIVAPDIARNTITYTDTENIQNLDGTLSSRTVSKTISGIPSYQVYVPDVEQKFTFLPDYNARYTVLAGESYLKEGSQILYDVRPGESQSLAVTTSLSSPYERENLFSLLPGGGFSVGSSLDTAIDTTLRNYGDTIILDAYDQAGEQHIAGVAYPLKGLAFSQCQERDEEGNTCNLINRDGGIMFVAFDDSDAIVGATERYMTMILEDVAKVTYDPSTGLSLAQGVTLETLSERSLGSLMVRVKYREETIGHIIIREPISTGVSIGDASSSVITLTLDDSHAYARNIIYGDTFDRDGRGYEIVRNPSSQILDERLTGPNHIDSLGSLLEIPGVGWSGKNRSLLSFAAGDIVGDATRWFHTYTMVNLGDPVAHVDSDAPETETEGLDRSIGMQIASSSDRHIQSFKRRDMDADGFEDILIVYTDGFIELLQNHGGAFRKKGKIAYIPNLTSLGIELGDFTGDDYADIITLDSSGSLVLYDNNERRITEPTVKNALFPEGVSQFRVYDMDADGRDDIVYLTEGGELGVLYGTIHAGVFDKKILDATLGITLSSDPVTTGGAIHASTTPASLLSTRPSSSTDADEGVLNSEVFYTLENNTPSSNDSIVLSPTTVDTEILTSVSQVVGSVASAPGEIYVRNEYAPAYGLTVTRSFANTSASTLHGGDRIEATITIKNTGLIPARGVKYLDILPKIFDIPPSSLPYRVTSTSGSRELPMEQVSGADYDLLFRPGDIGIGETVTLKYELISLPFSPGNMIVGDLEKGTVGESDDIPGGPFGDVGFETSTTCGADMLLWASTAVRTYARTTRTFTQAELPPSLASRLSDADGDGIPDSVQNMPLAERQAAYKNMTNTTSSISGGKALISTNLDLSNRLLSIGFSPDVERNIENIMQNLADGLSCGFGGGGCLSSPINWAPLAPGNDISVLGTPFGDGLKINEGLPIFSAMTGIPIYGPWGCFPVPAVWPPSPIGLENTCGSNAPNAGGYLGATSLANNIRIFVTPTLTLGMGTAICFGGAPAISGLNPFFPLIPKGNCIIITKPMNVCKGDGSSADGDVRGISGLGTTRSAWNSASCTIRASATPTVADTAILTSDIISYLKNPSTSKLANIYGPISQRGSRNTGNLGGPLIKLGDGDSSSPGIDISLDSSKPLTTDTIIKVRNRRISAFPEFIMDWFTRQTEEMKNKLFTLPNLIVIPPKSFGPNAQFGGDFSNFVSKFSEQSVKNGVQELGQKMDNVPSSSMATSLTKKTTGKTGSSAGYEKWLDGKIAENASTINTMDRGVNQVRAAYQFMGKLPFIRLEEVSIPISIPWLLPQDLDRYSRSLKQYQSEIDATKRGWCADTTSATCLDAHSNVGLGNLESSIKDNLRRIEEWKRFPEKIQKYVTWKQRYIAQILCNVDTLERMIGGWYRDNGIRFKKWAEFWVLMQAIVKSWQPFLDIWTEKDRSCSVCQNQRWDLNYWKFKLLSAVIPQIPILQFPRFPDIVLDLSDIRFAVLFRVPDFRFQINPIRLPDLPNLSLPDMPSVSFNFSGFGKIPAPPSLPDLPDLPSLPKINLPNLPPPPKLPKIFGAVSIALNIAKLLVKIECFRNKTFLVPEDYAGATIAQRTDRQGTLPFDFLNFRFPQIAIGAWPREIRVSSHVNFEMKSDFLVEFARSVAKPLESFNADFSRIPKKVAPDININGPQNINLTPRSSIDEIESIVAQMSDIQSFSGVLLDTDQFASYLRSEMLRAGMDVSVLDRGLRKARLQADALTRDLQTESEKSFTLMRDYLHAEEAETRELEKWIDTLSQPATFLADTAIPVAQFVSDTPSISEKSYERYQSHTLAIQEGVGDVQEESLSRDLASVTSRFGRLLTADPLLGAPGITMSDGYSPSFEGIYVLTPSSREQIRLFDYTDGLDGSEMVDISDIDRDGDDDYLYMMEGAVYVKYGHMTHPERAKDDSVEHRDIDMRLLPEAPDFFSETIASPGQLELSFAPAHPLDRQFRLEFYDRYMEWDKVEISGSERADTPRTVIDLTVRDTVPDPLPSIDAMSVRPVDRALESVSSAEGFTLEGMRVVTLGPPQEFTLSAGRPLYTGNSAASLSITDQATSETRVVTLYPFGQYTFGVSLSGVVLSGRAYVLTPSGTERLLYTSDMRGMPLLPGTRLIDTSGIVRIYEPQRGTSTPIEPLTEYRHVSLGTVSDTYRINIPYKNGFYSAQLTSLRTGNSISAGITLLAPLAALDRSSPVIDLSDLRIPVYQERELLFRDIISEVSPFTLRADPDVTTDIDGDGNYENDYTDTASGLVITAGGIVFGRYDRLGTHMLQMNITDAYSNTTLTPVQVDVYAPIPQIQSIETASGLLGSLDEEIESMPVHVFRVRGGEGIVRVTDSPSLTDARGAFGVPDISRPIDPSVQLGSDRIGLSRKTLLPLPSSGFMTKVIAATSTRPVLLEISDSTGTPRYTLDLVPPASLQIVSGTPLDSSIPQLFVETFAPATSVAASLSDPSIPGGRYIVVSGTPLIALDRYGQIYRLDESASLSVAEVDGHISITLARDGGVLARFQYLFDFFASSR